MPETDLLARRAGWLAGIMQPTADFGAQSLAAPSYASIPTIAKIPPGGITSPFNHPSGQAGTVFGSAKDPFYNAKDARRRMEGFKSFALPSRMATPRDMAQLETGFRGVFARTATSKFGRIVGGVARGLGKAAYHTGRIGIKAIEKAWHPRMWGLAARGGSGGFLSSIGRRAFGPAVLLGAFGLLGAGRNLIGGGYSMEGPGVAWGHTPGMSDPYTETTMSFSTANKMTQNMGATGSLAFALHNQRKG